MIDRLEAVLEETPLTLIPHAAAPDTRLRRLRTSVQGEGGAAILDVVARPGDGRIEDRMATLDNTHPVERAIDTSTVRVDIPGGASMEWPTGRSGLFGRGVAHAFDRCGRVTWTGGHES